MGEKMTNSEKLTLSAHQEMFGQDLISLILIITVLLVHVTRPAGGLPGVNMGDAAASLSSVPFLKRCTFCCLDNSIYMCASGKIDPMCQVPPIQLCGVACLLFTISASFS